VVWVGGVPCPCRSRSLVRCSPSPSAVVPASRGARPAVGVALASASRSGVGLGAGRSRHLGGAGLVRHPSGGRIPAAGVDRWAVGKLMSHITTSRNITYDAPDSLIFNGLQSRR
jgi:hypothetical protein